MPAPRFIVLAAAAATFLGSPNAEAQTFQGRQLVQAELLSDSTAVIPGKPFTIGLHLRMASGWHTYWKFPGDAGIPTEIKWKLPPGWKAGEIQWPIPLKLTEPGDIQIYGYHDEVLLMQQLIPPASIDVKSVNLSATATWLVCEKICIPGSAPLQIELPVEGQTASAHEDLFGRFRRALPGPWPAADVASSSWSRVGSELRLTVASSALGNYPVAQFYPLPPPSVVVAHPTTERSPDGKTLFRIPIETTVATVNSLDGIIVFGSAENTADRNAWSLNSQASHSTAAAKPTEKSGLARWLLLGFLGGFVLNLMPCVLPVISLKIFGFIQQAGQSRRRILRSGLAFAAGIFVWFIGLALLLIALRRAGREVIWAFQFTNPYFVLGMSVVVLVFALNLLGVFEISLPQRATRGALGWTTREGDAGAFFQGMFATILATPCTAPYLGTALGFAFSQSGLVILLMFISIAAGMSAPYLLLSAQPAWIRFLPRPGAWMEKVKQLLGFLLLATLLFLLYVLGAQRGVDGVIAAASFLLVLSVACWIKGAFATPSHSLRARAVSLVLVVVLVLGSAKYFIGTKFAASRVDVGSSLANDGWMPFTPERLQSELQAGHAVFVDFTAAWCITCKFNESTVLESAAVREAFAQRGIVKLKADWTNADPVITKILQGFGRPGVPFYVLYPSKTAEPITFPELLTKGIVLEKLASIGPNLAAQ